MNTILPDHVYFDTTINSTINLIESLNINVTRSTIRNSLYSSPSFPNLSLNDLVITFGGWGIKSIPCKVDYNTLQEVPLPIIAYFQDIDAASFVVINSVIDTTIDYYHPSLGYLKEDISSFQEKWTGIILIPDIDNTAGEKFFRENKIEEEKAKNAYKQSLLIIDDFLSDSESKYIIDFSIKNNLFIRSKLGKEGNEVTSHRTSYSAYIQDRKDPIITRIYQKAALQINKDVSLFESLQCVRYQPHQEFKFHFDSNKDIKRTHTFLIYLNDDFEGGETSFPELGIKVQPKTGRCVIFMNMDEYENIIPYSAHAGLPVKTGVKYACNLWVKSTPLQK